MGLIDSQLFDRVSQKGLFARHVAEVGVWHPETSNILQWILGGTRATLVEPDPESIAKIKAKFSCYANVALYEVAIAEAAGVVEMCKKGPSTFLSSIAGSPAQINDSCVPSESEKFAARAVEFSSIDDGTIDVISIDVEGAEWLVLRSMRSRPSVISIETHGGAYKNPKITEINRWLKSNKYTLWYKNGSDSVYVRDGLVDLSLSDGFRRCMQDVYLSYRAMRARVRRILRFKRR